MATPAELLMECDDDDLQPWQRHAGKEAAQGKKDPAEDPERTTVILTLLPVSPTERPLVPARTLPAHTPGSPVARALVMTPAPPLASQPLVLTAVPPPASLPLQTVSSCSLPGQPIIVSTQTLQGVSTDQTNPMMGLILNGQPITLLPGGQLLPQPSSFQLLAPAIAPAQGVGGTGNMAGEAGRFTTLTIRSPTGVQTITTVASSRNLSVPSPPSPLPPPAITSPIITEVVSMGALESADSPAVRLAKPAAASPAPSRSTPTIFFPKARSPTRPQMCIRCGTRYTLVNALRGHMCICSIKIAQSLKRINSSKSSKAKKHSSKGSKSSDSSDSSSSSEEESTQTTKKRKKKEKNEKTSSRGKSSKGKQSPRPKSAAKRISLEGEGEREWRREGKREGRKSGEREGKKSRKRKGERDGPGEEKRHKELGSEVRPVYGDPSSPILEAESRGKLIILAEDFYYGTDRNCRPDTAHKQIKPFKCVYCDRNISDNIKLMNHTKQHVELNREEDELVAQTSCDLCFRQFPTPYRLQGHIESVHGSFECTAKCKICEWAYESEPAFLQHMKNFHKPGEMPYVCQVCQFRSSFYSEVMDHFREAHSDTSHLICPYCLKVFRYGLNYQHHYIRHQKKTVFRCDCCRLQFLFAKERAEHKVQDHKTHIKPKQLEGLKAGTKVTIRTYAAAGSRVPPPEDVDRRTPFLPPRVIDVPPAPQVAVSPKRTPPESLAHLLTTFQTHSPESQNCVECSFSIPDFLSHYPTYVHCSLCRYRTCCSRAYANHMINNHVTRKRTSNYATMYESYPRERKMRCTSCRYSTTIGDMMANHLTDHPGHLSASFNTTDDLELSPIIDDTPLTGSFVPFDQLTAGTPQLSIKPLLASSRPPTPSPAPSPSPTPSMTIRLQGSLASIRDGVLEGTLGALDVTAGQANGHLSPAGAAILDIVGKVQPPPSQTSPPTSAPPSPAKPLTVRQLTIVLYALCNGLPQAAQRYGTRPQDIRAWTQVQDRQRLKKEWRWCTDRIAEWVLSQREEQLPINEENLLQTATEALDEAQEIGDFYQWAVEFMLRHNLGLQAALASMVRPPLPRNVFESTRIFTRFMAKQTREQSLRPGDLAAVDELSVFVDAAELAFCGPGALQLFGEGCAPVDMVLACLADGTFLPPMLFVRAPRADPDPALQGRVFLEASPGGFTDEQRLQLWLDKVWRPRWRAQGSAKNLLVMDTHRGHLADAYLAGLSGTSTIPAVIPIGCSARLQPLEVCVAPVLREFLQARWSQMAETGGGAVGPGLGELAARLADWLGELATCLQDRPEILQRSFKIVCTSPTEEETDSATAIMHFLTEALLGDQEEEKGEEEKGEEPAGGEEEREKGEEGGTASEVSSVCMSPQAQLHAVRQVFEKDSDLESFHGFEDREVAEFMHHARASPCQ